MWSSGGMWTYGAGIAGEWRSW